MPTWKSPSSGYFSFLYTHIDQIFRKTVQLSLHFFNRQARSYGNAVLNENRMILHSLTMTSKWTHTRTHTHAQTHSNRGRNNHRVTSLWPECLADLGYDQSRPGAPGLGRLLSLSLSLLQRQQQQQLLPRPACLLQLIKPHCHGSKVKKKKNLGLLLTSLSAVSSAAFRLFRLV